MSINQLARTIKSMKTKQSDIPDIVFGTVASVSPLTIQTDIYTEPLDEDFLVLSENVKDVEKKMLIDGQMRTVTILNELKTGESVVILRAHQGQMFYVLERA